MADEKEKQPVEETNWKEKCVPIVQGAGEVINGIGRVICAVGNLLSEVGTKKEEKKDNKDEIDITKY